MSEQGIDEIKALAVNSLESQEVVIAEREQQALVTGPVIDIGDTITALLVRDIGAIELTDEEVSVLSEPLDPAIVRIRPEGIVYVPHIFWRKQFDKAFGQLQWSIVPMGKGVNKKQNEAHVRALFYLRGKAAFEISGKSVYYESNAVGSYADSMESAESRLHTRAGKRLNLWLELWDQLWVENWKNDFAVLAKLESKGNDKKTIYQWRHPEQRPFKSVKKGDLYYDEVSVVKPALALR